MAEKCNSCKRDITNLEEVTRFSCPQCQEYEIIRCGECRRTVVKYTCPKCEFVGPN